MFFLLSIQEYICSAHDILYLDPTSTESLTRLSRTVASLVSLVQAGKQSILNQQRRLTGSSISTNNNTSSSNVQLPMLNSVQPVISPNNNQMASSWHSTMFSHIGSSPINNPTNVNASKKQATVFRTASCQGSVSPGSLSQSYRRVSHSGNPQSQPHNQHSHQTGQHVAFL